MTIQPPVDLRLLGSRPADTVDVFDWRHELSMSIQAFADSSKKIAEALNEGGEKAAYIRANARQFGEKLPLELVCSVWISMEGLGTTTSRDNRADLQYSDTVQGEMEAAEAAE